MLQFYHHSHQYSTERLHLNSIQVDKTFLEYQLPYHKIFATNDISIKYSTSKIIHNILKIHHHYMTKDRSHDGIYSPNKAKSRKIIGTCTSKRVTNGIPAEHKMNIPPI